MDLSYRDLGGSGQPVVILHGLFGSSQNWAGMGRRLADSGRVFALDLRNHGESPHAATHSLADCVEDLADWARARGCGPMRLIGHSMGGLVAMAFALRHPESTAGVASVDIAPRAYPPDHAQEAAALRTDISRYRSRAEVEAVVAPLIPDARERQFLLTNAVRKGEGFAWRLNMDALEKSTLSSDWADVTGLYEGEALLLAGGRSGYVRPEDHALMRRFFPRARVETLADADHWPHVTAAAELEARLRGFLARAAIKPPPARL